MTSSSSGLQFKSSCTLPTLNGEFEMRVYTDALTGRDSIAMVARVRHGAAGLEARGGAASPVAGAGASSSAAAAAASVRDVPAGCAVLRVQDACITSEVFGSVKCDCASQLDYSMALLARLAGDASAEAAQSSSGCVCRSSSDSGSPAIDAAGNDAIVGLVVYLLQEGRGIGLAAKVSAYALQEDGGGGGGGGDSSSGSGGGSSSQGAPLPRGLDTVDANRALGLPDDSREYSAVSDILRDVGLLPGDAAAAPPLYLLSNNPRKAAALGALGVPLAGSLPCYVEPVSPHAQRYLRVKAERMGHVLPQLSGWRWDEPPFLGQALAARHLHTATLWVDATGETRVIVCGGRLSDSDSTYVGGCTLVDPFRSWQVSFSRGASAVGRAGGVAALTGAAGSATQQLVLWGGMVSGTNVSESDCEVFAVGDTWVRAATQCVGDVEGMVPEARWGASSVQVGQSLYVFGGASPRDEDEASMDVDDGIVWLLDLSGAGAEHNLQWSKVPAAADRPPPAPRHYHAAAVLAGTGGASDVMFVHGGYSFEGGARGDLWQLTLAKASYVWVERSQRVNPPERYGHVLVVTGGLLIAYGGAAPTPAGGADIISTPAASPAQPGEWSTPTVTGTPPRFPFGAAAVLLDANSDGTAELVVFCGQDPATNASTSKAGVLSEIGVDYAPLSKELPIILGGAAVAVFVLLALGMLSWRSRVHAALEDDAGALDVLDAEYGGAAAFKRSATGGSAASSLMSDEDTESLLRGGSDSEPSDEEPDEAYAGYSRQLLPKRGVGNAALSNARAASLSPKAAAGGGAVGGGAAVAGAAAAGDPPAVEGTAAVTPAGGSSRRRAASFRGSKLEDRDAAVLHF